MIMFIGIGLALGNWISFALLTFATIATYAYRVAVEERALLEAIGEPYGSYMKGRTRFIPLSCSESGDRSGLLHQ
jgi:protein-S-isoprenylcysteine O-methyltransferase Ste14